jgi:prephenate dehydrogenase
MTADRHDRLVAASSHLPYVVASLLMRQAWETAQQDDRLWQVSASGLRDTTRLAGSNPEMMLEILLANRQAVLRQLETYREDLNWLAELLRGGDEETLRHNLKDAHRQRTEYFQNKYGEDSSE